MTCKVYKHLADGSCGNICNSMLDDDCESAKGRRLIFNAEDYTTGPYKHLLQYLGIATCTIISSEDPIYVEVFTQ